MSFHVSDAFSEIFPFPYVAVPNAVFTRYLINDVGCFLHLVFCISLKGILIAGFSKIYCRLLCCLLRVLDSVSVAYPAQGSEG